MFRSLTEYLAVQNLGHLKACERLYMIVKISMDVQIINRVSRGSKPWTLKKLTVDRKTPHSENHIGCASRGSKPWIPSSRMRSFFATAKLCRDVEAKTSCCGFGAFDGRGHTCFESLQLILNVRWRTSLQNLSWRRP